MRSKQALTLDDVKKIAAAAEAEALANKWAVTIAIVDDGGNPLWLQRLDGAPPVSASIARLAARSVKFWSRASSRGSDGGSASAPAAGSVDSAQASTTALKAVRAEEVGWRRNRSGKSAACTVEETAM